MTDYQRQKKFHVLNLKWDRGRGLNLPLIQCTQTTSQKQFEPLILIFPLFSSITAKLEYSHFNFSKTLLWCTVFSALTLHQCRCVMQQNSSYKIFKIKSSSTPNMMIHQNYTLPEAFKYLEFNKTGKIWPYI